MKAPTFLFQHKPNSYLFIAHKVLGILKPFFQEGLKRGSGQSPVNASPGFGAEPRIASPGPGQGPASHPRGTARFPFAARRA